MVIEPGEDGVFAAKCPALPGSISQGKTRADALANVNDAMTDYSASVKKLGEPTLIREAGITKEDFASLL